MGNREDHRERARLLRRVLGAFRSEDDASPADRVVRRRVEGAMMAEELAAGELAASASDPGDHVPTG